MVLFESADPMLRLIAEMLFATVIFLFPTVLRYEYRYMRIAVSHFVLMIVIALAMPSFAQNQTYSDDEVLRYAKSIDVSKLDSTLASQPLDTWLRTGPARIVELDWRVSRDCDLKDPVPDAEGDLPLCVRVAFRRGNASGLGMLRVGTLKRGISGLPGFQYPFGVITEYPIKPHPQTLSELPQILDEVPQVGTVCIVPNPSERPTRISPGVDYNPSTLKVRIDKQQPVLWPHKQSVKSEGLSLSERHVVVLTSDGKQIQSFRFEFADYKDAKLCLAFDGYQGVQLASKKGALWCSCK
jgi:hypothetical protein